MPAYLGAQVVGAFAGVATADVMFELPVFFASRKARAGGAQLFSEFVATLGLLAVIWGCVRLKQKAAAPFAVASYITAAYWFTSSTSFANPTVTLARSTSDTFAGIRPADVPGFVVAQLLGATGATLLFRWLIPSLPEEVGGLSSRTGRKEENAVKVLLAIDEEPGSEETVSEVGSRRWEEGTVVRVLHAVGKFVPSAQELWYDAGGDPEQARQEVRGRSTELTERVGGWLREQGLTVEMTV